MLGDDDAVPTIGVKDLEAARRFYSDTLGLRPVEGEQEPTTLAYHAGRGTVLVYESEYAGTNRATAVTWPLADVDATVRTLRERGVTFEHYDMPETTREGDVHVSGHMRVAWFKDPDGNIHALVNDGPR